MSPSYLWNPDFGDPTYTNITESSSLSSLIGSLPSGTVEKFAELYFLESSSRQNNPSNGTSAVVMRVSQNATGSTTSYYVIPGAQIQAVTSSSLMHASSDSNGGATTGTNGGDGNSNVPIIAGVIGGVGGVACLSVVGSVAGFVGYKYFKNKHQSTHDHLEGDKDVELGSRRPTNDAFKAREGKGLKDMRLRVTGSMFGVEYGLYFTVDREESEEIGEQTGLRINIPEGRKEVPFCLGEGNFGRVIIAKDEGSGNFKALKIVAGNSNVKASLREGKLQSCLRDNEDKALEGVLPLEEYLHFSPTGKNKKEMSQLLEAAFGSTTVNGVDMINQDLLLQVTPLIAFGNGSTFQRALADVKDETLKDELLTHFARSLMTGLVNMHDKGISHLDIKPGNILVHGDGSVYISDFGCAVQKDNVSGGNGDAFYFPPERLDAVRSLIAQGAAKSQKKQGSNTNAPTHYSGQKADVFALGVTLLEVALNAYPLPRENGFKKVMKARDSDYFSENLAKALAKLNSKLSIYNVIEQLLALKVGSRPNASKSLKLLKSIKLDHTPQELFEELTRKSSSSKGGFDAYQQANYVQPLENNSKEDQATYVDNPEGAENHYTGSSSTPYTLNRDTPYVDEVNSSPQAMYATSALPFYNVLQAVYGEDS